MIFKITCKIVYGHNKQRVGNVVISSEPVSENSDRDIHLPFSPLPHLLQFHSCRVTVDVIEEMRVFRSQGGCVAIRTLSPSSSINRYSHAHGSAPGPAASGTYFINTMLIWCF